MAVKIEEKFDKEPIVIIKPQAYIKMLKHVLLHGNANKAESVEVMGICYGKQEGGKIVQYDAVPMSHGGAIEVEFAPEDYAAFAVADEQFAEKGWFAIGWYHSHPALKAFFSKTDIKNQLFYQKDQTPYAYGIVFDHTYFDLGDEALKWGFKAFRLNDYKRGINSDYHEIRYEVELPDDLSYYNEIDSIIEAIQKKKPVIAEAREGMDDIGTWEEPTGEEVTEEGPKDTFKDIKQGYQDGLNNFNTGFMLPIMDELQQFTKDTQSSALKGPEVIVQTLEEMRDTIEGGLGRVQTFFEKSLDKEIEDVSKSIEDQLKKFIQNQMEIPKKMQAFMSKMSESLSIVIGNQLETALEGIIGNMKKLVFSAEKIAEKQQEFAKNITDQEASVKQFTESVKTIGTQLQGSIGNLPKNVNALVSKRTDSFKASINDLKKSNDEMKVLLDDLTKILMNKRK